MKKIKITKANVHNLKNISVEIPRNALTVITGPSGSGKSSLAFDTIFAEGQRRYIESLSSYSRQFLGQMEAPEVESITGLSPAIAIDQKSTSRNPRSTVGTVTEIYDYLRIFYARLGIAHCPDCGDQVQAQTKQQISKSILKNPDKTKIQILSPIVNDRKGEHKELLSQFQIQGYSRIYLNKKLHTLDDSLKINKNKRNTIHLVIDRIAIKKGISSRLIEAIETASKMGNGHIHALVNDEWTYYSERNFCSNCHISFPDLEPRLFSFNSPLGSCEECNGLGESQSFDPIDLIDDKKISIEDGAIPLVNRYSFFSNMLKSVAKKEKVDLSKPYNKLNKKFIDILFNGSEKEYQYNFESENSKFAFKKAFPGLIFWLNRRYHEGKSEKVRNLLEKYLTVQECHSCNGEKLKPYPLATLVKNKNIFEISNLSINEAFNFLTKLKFKTKNQNIIASKLLKEINSRLEFLLNVGLDYLNLNRKANTLSGGESQRIRLATQIGSALSGVLYVLDEPSIGLHQRDNIKLINTLKNLRELGNTVIVVEHDEETIINADHLIDIGPAAGKFGGEIVDYGSPKQVIKRNKGITAQYLSQKKKIEIPKRRKLKEKISIKKAQGNNLKNLDIEIPLQGLVCITGVSGSGKSTLVHNVLARAIKDKIQKREINPNIYQKFNSSLQIDSLIKIDQTPIGRTPKSNPATYTGLFDSIRNLFAKTNEAKIRGYKAGRFSFNVKEGRCDKCEGNGQLKIEMHFLPDVYINCDECQGKRYNDETLTIQFKNKNIYDVLEMSVNEAFEFFQFQTKIAHILKTLIDVGLGYIKLGQPATTLSGGEAQRMKLAKELAKRARGHTFYILDEPTTGLHFEDINILLKAINKLIDQGNSMLIIEHNLDVVKTADWIIDLGPEGGLKGGQIVAKGTPEAISKVKKSHTGQFLKKLI